MNGMLAGLKKESKNHKPSARPGQSILPVFGPECGLRPTSVDLNLNFFFHFLRQDDGTGGWKWMGWDGGMDGWHGMEWDGLRCGTERGSCRASCANPQLLCPALI